MKLGRSELKYLISSLDEILLKKRLSTIMKLDEHSNSKGEYKVNSIYFDNSQNKIFNEKMNGIYERKKFRIRWYGNDNTNLNLEKKLKENNLTFKTKTKISKEELKKIINNDIEWMLKDNRELVRELYLNMTLYNLKPQTIVSYDRIPFTFPYGNVRITLDRNLKTSIYNINPSDNNFSLVNVLEKNNSILEIKYDEYLPEFLKELLQIGNKRQISVSKYILCRMYG